MFKKMPIILIIVLALSVLLGSYVPEYYKQVLYSISLTIKTVIIFSLPFIIFGLLFRSTANLSKKATAIIGLVLAFVCLSNFISTLISHFVGAGIYQSNLSITLPKNLTELSPLWSFSLPVLITNDKAMFLGLALGIILPRIIPGKIQTLTSKIESFINAVLSLIILIIPLFIVGFIMKMQYEGTLQHIIGEYMKIFAVILASLLVYLLALYFILSGARIKVFIEYIRNMIPAMMTALSTMSSAVAMPLTIIGVKKNSKNKGLVDSVVPATANIHLIGDCFAIPIFAYAILKTFGLQEPSWINYLIFSLYFVLAKFSVAAVPGGGILVMLPILQKYLNFDSNMLSMITALYILFDPIITSFNVLGNGAFAKFIDVIVSFIDRKSSKNL